jgi:hypothetical protein
MAQTILGGEQPCKPQNTSGGTPNGEPLWGASRQSENDWVQQYERRPHLECPIVSGDEVDHSPVMKGTVTAFLWHGNSSDPSDLSKGLDLCELTTSKGAEELALAELAEREIDRKGLRPPVRLASLSGPSAVTAAPVSFVESMQEFLAAPLVASAQNKLSGAEILSAVGGAGYDVFVGGGAVRDSLRNAHRRSVHRGDAEWQISDTGLKAGSVQ